MVWASDKGASLVSPLGAFLGQTNWEKTQGWTYNSLERLYKSPGLNSQEGLYISPGLRTSLNPAGGVVKC